MKQPKKKAGRFKQVINSKSLQINYLEVFLQALNRSRKNKGWKKPVEAFPSNWRIILIEKLMVKLMESLLYCLKNNMQYPGLT